MTKKPSEKNGQNVANISNQNTYKACASLKSSYAWLQWQRTIIVQVNVVDGKPPKTTTKLKYVSIEE